MKKEIIDHYLKGIANPSEKEQLMDWLDECPENRAKLQAYNKLYESSIWFDASQSTKTSQKVSTSFIRVFTNQWMQFAAVFFLGVLITYFLYKPVVSDPLLVAVHTPSGQRAELTLEDGTTVWLNANSTIRYPNHFSKSNRMVSIDGEAFLKVAHNKERPFIVDSKGFKVTVLGTEFNIKNYSHAYFRTSLLKGSIRVTTPSNEEILLEPDYCFTSINGKNRISKIANKQYFDWRKGLLCFEHKSIPAIMNRLELYFDVQIHLNNESIVNEYYSGKFRINDGIEHVLKVLQIYSKFSYEINESRDVITIN